RRVQHGLAVTAGDGLALRLHERAQAGLGVGQLAGAVKQRQVAAVEFPAVRHAVHALVPELPAGTPEPSRPHRVILHLSSWRCAATELAVLAGQRHRLQIRAAGRPPVAITVATRPARSRRPATALVPTPGAAAPAESNTPPAPVAGDRGQGSGF